MKTIHGLVSCSSGLKGVKKYFHVHISREKKMGHISGQLGENIHFHSLLVVVKAIVIYLTPKVSEAFNNL